MSINPRSIKAACVTFANGQTISGGCHGVCLYEAEARGWYGSVDEAFDAIRLEGFITHGGEILTREQAYHRAIETRAMTRETYQQMAEESGCALFAGNLARRPYLESITFEEAGGELMA